MIESIITAIIGAVVGGLAVALLVPFIRVKWEDFKKGKERRKLERDVKKYDRRLKKELRKAGLPKDEL